MRKTLPSRRRDYTGGLIVSLSLIIVMYVFDLPKLESWVTLFTIVVISVTMREMTQLFQK
ncbi:MULTISPECIES: hypothetical protein [unclassified Exiguobacterium]|uniref:hypothetical protein n=1 Tax=unclassified Exiguobacterium TaxID=2644629 RepID=UPI001BE98D78|nr:MULTISPECIES: hypothetical protein [unclassified Exiguobacterium]